MNDSGAGDGAFNAADRTVADISTARYTSGDARVAPPSAVLGRLEPALVHPDARDHTLEVRPLADLDAKNARLLTAGSVQIPGLIKANSG
jgi:hypothetical protein